MPWYCVSTKAMFICCKDGEPKNANSESVEKADTPVRASKLLGFVQRHIGPTMEICVNSGLPIAMVSCLH